MGVCEKLFSIYFFFRFFFVLQVSRARCLPLFGTEPWHRVMRCSSRRQPEHLGKTGTITVYEKRPCESRAVCKLQHAPCRLELPHVCLFSLFFSRSHFCKQWRCSMAPPWLMHSYFSTFHRKIFTFSVQSTRYHLFSISEWGVGARGRKARR